MKNTEKLLQDIKRALNPYVSRGDKTNSAQAALTTILKDFHIVPRALVAVIDSYEPELGDIVDFIGASKEGTAYVGVCFFDDLGEYIIDEATVRTIQRNNKPALKRDNIITN